MVGREFTVDDLDMLRLGCLRDVNTAGFVGCGIATTILVFLSKQRREMLNPPEVRAENNLTTQRGTESSTETKLPTGPLRRRTSTLARRQRLRGARSMPALQPNHQPGSDPSDPGLNTHAVIPPQRRPKRRHRSESLRLLRRNWKTEPRSRSLKIRKIPREACWPSTRMAKST